MGVDAWDLLCDFATKDEDYLLDLIKEVELNQSDGLTRFAKVYDNSPLCRRILYLTFTYGAYCNDLEVLFPQVDFLHHALPNTIKINRLIDWDRIIPYPNEMKMFDDAGVEMTVGMYVFERYCSLNCLSNLLKMKISREYFFGLNFYNNTVRQIASSYAMQFDLDQIEPKNVSQIRILWDLQRKPNPTIDDIEKHLQKWLKIDVNFFGYDLTQIVEGKAIYVHCMHILLYERKIDHLVRLTRLLPTDCDYFSEYLSCSNLSNDRALLNEFKKRLKYHHHYEARLSILTEVLR